VPYIFLGAFALLALIVVMNWAVNADAVTLRKFVRYMGAFLLTAGAAIMAARGGLAFVGPMLLGAFLLATGKRLPGFGSGAKTAGQQSQVETSHLHVTLDHDSGDMNGTVKDGTYMGRSLVDLDRDELSSLYAELKKVDPDGARLLDAYLARRFKGEWQESDTQQGSSGAAAGPMTRDEALEVLGLSADANESQIKTAHRRLMKKFHPDQGGSTYFAARINQAKDLLLG